MTKLVSVRHSALVTDGARQTTDLQLSADVCVIGTGAGGAVTAATLAQAGMHVLIIEEGGYYTSADFTTRERDCVPHLFQDAMARTTRDASISILQGKAVGGGTVVNWTTSFRTPEDVVEHWQKKHAVGGFTYADLLPHYDAIEDRLAIRQVTYASLNQANKVLYDGCTTLGWHVSTLKRNVYGCMQTGFCHLGCPVNAKRSMLVTMIPDAIDAGAQLLFRARADRLEHAAQEVSVLHGTLMDSEGRMPTGKTFTVRAKRFIVSGGAINSPALLLRSGLDSDNLVGSRTFIHPVVASSGTYTQDIHPYQGAPQSAASHHFARRGDEVGFFMESAPWHPVLAATAAPGYGQMHESLMNRARHLASHIAITIDGFHDDMPGGRVALRASGAPVLDYPIPDRLWAAFRFAQERLADMQFASGAHTVSTFHDDPVVMQHKTHAANIAAASWQPGSVALFLRTKWAVAAWATTRTMRWCAVMICATTQ